MSEAIVIENLGKKFIISHEKEALIRHLLPTFLSIKRYEEFWALRDICLNLKQGECLGVIGRNGAGKSTLLNILSGITLPTCGKVKVKGSICAILSLGAGFHPELTGEENIYLNGSILGMGQKEIRSKFDKIVEFSELGGFIDAPLQAYSNGMYLRLGFSIAVHTDFDILLIDEILGVGDINFQDKCMRKLAELRSSGKSMVIASQSPETLQPLSDRIAVLEKGSIDFIGNPQEAAAHYRKIMQGEVVRPSAEHTAITPVGGLGYVSEYERSHILADWHSKSGNQQIQITDVELSGIDGENKNTFSPHEDIIVKVKFKVNNEVANPHFGIAIFAKEGVYCYGPNTKFDGIRIEKLRKGEGQVSIRYLKPPLACGQYAFSVVAWEEEERFAYDYHYAYYDFQICDHSAGRQGLLQLPCKWKVQARVSEKGGTGGEIIDFAGYIRDEKWLKDASLDVLELTGKKLTDGRSIKNIFESGEPLIFFLELFAQHQIEKPVLWVGLFGDDRLYFQGDRIAIDRINKGRSSVSFIYPELDLLRRRHPGLASEGRNFVLCFAVAQGGKDYCRSFAEFGIMTDRQDHGAVYIKHKWQLNLS